MRLRRNGKSRSSASRRMSTCRAGGRGFAAEADPPLWHPTKEHLFAGAPARRMTAREARATTEEKAGAERLRVLLPGIAAGGWGPVVLELAEKDNAAEVVGIVGGQGDELLAHSHSAVGVAEGGAGDGDVLAGGVVGERRGGLGSSEEAGAD